MRISTLFWWWWWWGGVACPHNPWSCVVRGNSFFYRLLRQFGLRWGARVFQRCLWISFSSGKSTFQIKGHQGLFWITAWEELLLPAGWQSDMGSCYTDPWIYKLGLGTCNVTSIVGIVDIAMLSSGYCGFADCSVSAMLKTLFTDATVVQSNNGDIWTW